MSQEKPLLTLFVLKILRPLARVLLRHQMAHAEFSELAKHAYLDAAKRYYALPGRKLTHSRLSVLTGLSRKEVVRLTELPAEAYAATKGPINRARQVIRGWLDDHDFRESNGEPRELPLRGAGSFEELAMRYSGDITGRAILDELLRVGVAEKVGKTHVRLLQHGYIPIQSDSERMTILAKHWNDLLETGVHNLEAGADDLRFQRQLTYHDVNEDIAREFQQFSRQRAMDLLVEFDQWLAERKKSQIKSADVKQVRLGMGVYYFENEGVED